MIFMIVVFILMMQFLWLYIDDLVGKGLSFWVIMEFLGWGTGTVIPLALPLATLIASIMTLGNMGESNELLAMKAAGISLGRILVPLIIVSALISVGAFFISNNFIPISYNKIFTLQYDIGKTKGEIKIPTGTFYNGIDGYTLRIEERNKKSGMMYDVMVYNHTSHKGNISLAVADSGSIKSTHNKSALIFTLYNGVSYEETNQSNINDTSRVLQKIEFSKQEVIIPLENYAFEKSNEERYGNEIMAKKLQTLRHDRDSISIVQHEVLDRQHKRFVYDSDHKYAIQLDTARNKGYSRKLELDTLYSKIDNEQKEDYLSEAITSLSLPINKLEAYERESNQYTFSLRRIDLESFRKFALSFACFVFFFIGAPLGAIIRKGGLGTPVIVSSLFFVLYWVVDITGIKLARDGVITPALGAFISTLVLMPIGIFLTWKSTKDSSLFNPDTYIAKIKKFFKQFQKGKMKYHNKELRIVFMGTPEFAVGSLSALLENGYNVVGVVTVPDKPSGRGQKINQSEVKEYLAINNEDIPILQPASLKDPLFLEELSSLKGDLFVVVAFRMLPKVVWSMPRLGTFNLHASLLPEYRGAAPINHAIINGESKTGVTTFLLDERIDTGSILFQEEMPIGEDDTFGEVYEKLMQIGAKLLLKSVDAIAEGHITPLPQKEGHHGAPKITKETGNIDWSKSSLEIHNLIRGLNPNTATSSKSKSYPVAHSLLSIEGKLLEVKIFKARPLFCNTYLKGEENGKVYSDGKKMMCVKCGKNEIEILEIQVAGKKRINIKDFLVGYHTEWKEVNFIFKNE